MNTIPNTGPIVSTSSGFDSVSQNQVNTSLNNNPAPSSSSVTSLEMNINQSKNSNNNLNSGSNNNLNAGFQASGTQNANLINYRKDNTSQKAVIEIKDKESGKVKYQIPPEVSLRISSVIQNTKGENIDKSV